MKTYNQFLNTPFSEEVKPEPPELPEPQEDDSDVKSKEKRQKQIKKMVLLKKLQAVRAGAGADIVAGYEPEGEELKEYSPNVTYQAKGGKKSGKLGKSSVYSLRGKDESKKDFRKSQVKDIKGGYLKTEEVELDEAYGGKRTSRKARLASIHPPTAQAAIKDIPVDNAQGAGNKARRRAGEKVEAKSPTYLAHVLNKKKKVSEEKDAYKYVVSQLKKKYPGGVLTKGDKMPEPSAAQKKKNAEIRAKRAKEDHRDPTEKASDGRYSDRYSNRGSD